MVKNYLFILLILISPIGFSSEFIEGQDYQVITPKEHFLVKGNKVQVTEFFSYGCPWCARLESSLMDWVAKQGQTIYFTKVPVVFNPHWAYYARAYYIIQSLSLGKSVHENLFQAIAVDKKPLHDAKSLAEFFKKNGVDPLIAEKAFSDMPSLEIKLKVDQEMMVAYQINSVPTIVINGKYKTNLQMTKSEPRFFEVLDFLITKAKSETRK